MRSRYWLVILPVFATASFLIPPTLKAQATPNDPPPVIEGTDAGGRP